VLAQVTARVAGAVPRQLRHEPDGVADGFGDQVANGELQPLAGQRADQGVGVAGTITLDQDRLAPPPVRQLSEGFLQHAQVVGGGVAAGVPGPQDRRQRLAGVVQPSTDRVEAEAALEVARGALFVRVRRHQRRVQIDHQLLDRPVGGAGAG